MMRSYHRIHESMFHTICALMLSLVALSNASCSNDDASGVNSKKLSDLNLEEARQFCRDSAPDIETTLHTRCQFETAQDTASGDLTLMQCDEEWKICDEFGDVDNVDCDQITQEDVGNDCDVTVGEFLDCFAKWAELWSDIAEPLSCEKAVDGIDESILTKAKAAENPKICEKVQQECLTDSDRYTTQR